MTFEFVRRMGTLARLEHVQHVSGKSAQPTISIVTDFQVSINSTSALRQITSVSTWSVSTNIRSISCAARRSTEIQPE